MIPQFYGDEDGDKAWGWLLSLEQHFQAEQTHEDDMLHEAVKGLRGCALTWYKGWSWRNPHESWRSFDRAFVGKYIPEICLVDEDEESNTPEPVAESVLEKQEIIKDEFQSDWMISSQNRKEEQLEVLETVEKLSYVIESDGEAEIEVSNLEKMNQGDKVIVSAKHSNERKEELTKKKREISEFNAEKEIHERFKVEEAIAMEKGARVVKKPLPPMKTACPPPLPEPPDLASCKKEVHCCCLSKQPQERNSMKKEKGVRLKLLLGPLFDPAQITFLIFLSQPKENGICSYVLKGNWASRPLSPMLLCEQKSQLPIPISANESQHHIFSKNRNDDALLGRTESGSCSMFLNGLTASGLSLLVGMDGGQWDPGGSYYASGNPFLVSKPPNSDFYKEREDGYSWYSHGKQQPQEKDEKPREIGAELTLQKKHQPFELLDHAQTTLSVETIVGWKPVIILCFMTKNATENRVLEEQGRTTLGNGKRGPNGNPSISRVARTLCFKQWDPGGSFSPTFGS